MRGLKLLVLGVVLAAMPAFTQPYAAWSKWRTVKVSTLDTTGGGAGVANAVNNFPLLVRLSNTSTATGSDVLIEAGANGASIRFTTAAGDTALPYEIDTWTSTSAAIWVKVPVVRGNDSTQVRLYWGKTGAVSESNGGAVFDTANAYRSVWHLGNAAGSAARPNSVTPYANLPAVPNVRGRPIANAPGVIGLSDTIEAPSPANAISSADTLQYFRVDSGTIVTNAYNFPARTLDGATGMITFSYWAKRAWPTVVERKVFAIGGPPSPDPVTAIVGNVPNAIAHFYTGTSTTTGQSSYFRWTGPPAAGGTPAAQANTATTNGYPLLGTDWVYVSGTIARGADRDTSVQYINGLQTSSAAGLIEADTMRTDSLRLHVVIGRTLESVTAVGFIGSMDEFTLSNARRTPSWMRLNYQTQKPGATAVTLGATQVAVIAPPPTNVTGVAGNTAVTVSWTASAGAVSYTATSSPGGLTCAAIGNTSCLVTSLTNGTAYKFTVTSTNGAGTSAPSDSSAAVTPTAPGGVPASPTAVGGTPQNGAVAVTWTASASGSPTGYKATNVQTGLSCTTAATTCTVSGLTNGSSYTFVVVATNGSGPSAPSTVSGAIIPRTVPDAVTNVVATLNNTAGATLTWTAPASNGGSAITGYTVTGGGTCAVSGTATTCNTAGLTAGTAYTLTVVATNAAGNSAGATVTFTPRAVPSAPATVTFTSVAGSGSAVVTWAAATANGSAVTAYTVTRNPAGTTCTPGAALTCTITGLTTGNYTFTVTATNLAGTGPGTTSASGGVTPILPGFAQGLFGFEGQNMFRVSANAVASVEKVSIRVTDMQGRTVWSKSVHPSRDGVREISWDASQGFTTSGGMYMVHAAVTVDGQVQRMTRKTVALKP